MLRFGTFVPVLFMLVPDGSAVEFPPRIEWMGSYLNRSKVGYSVSALAGATEMPEPFKAAFTGEDYPRSDFAYLLYSESDIAVTAYGRRNRVRTRTTAGLAPDFTVRRFVFELGSRDAEVRVTGEVMENEVNVTVGSSGDDRADVIPTSGNPVYLPEILPALMWRKIEAGESIDGEYSVLEPHQVSLSKWRIALEGKEIVGEAGEAVETYRIRQDSGGFTPITWIEAGGGVVKEWAPLGEAVGYSSFRETEAEAKDPGYIHPRVRSALPAVSDDGAEPDLLYATSVGAGRTISNSASVKRMVVDLWDFDLDRPIPEWEGQRNLCQVEQKRFTRSMPLRLEVTAPDPPSESFEPEPTPSFQAKYAAYLEPETLIQVNHPEIVELARSLTAGLGTAWEKAQAVGRWMAEEIETEFRITLPSALEVLHSRKGDCNEQSALFTALARAAGVPTRVCTGLVYQSGAFYYHAWNEVLVHDSPERWIPVDPALRQEVADATHVKFGEGSLAEQTYLNGLIGKIRANVVEVEPEFAGP